MSKTQPPLSTLRMEEGLRAKECRRPWEQVGAGRGKGQGTAFAPEALEGSLGSRIQISESAR